MIYSSPVPSIFTIFGATGDLAVKKIFPALRKLSRTNLLPAQFRVIAFARRALEPNLFPPRLLAHHHGHFDNPADFVSLAGRVQSIEKEWGVCANKLWYFAAPPVWYETLVKNLASAKLNLPCSDGTGYSRILIEKPFGRDLASARALQRHLSKYFTEEQIFRIDHYLFKEAVCGRKRFGFSAPFLAEAMQKGQPERIEVRLLERKGVEGRGAFYDGVGALRDVVQSHLLELLAAALGTRRAKVIASLAPWTKERIEKNTFRAQYDEYQNITGVMPHSETETFVSLRTTFRRPPWRGREVYLEAGKWMKEEKKEIVLVCKNPRKKIMFRLEQGATSEHAALLSAALAGEQSLFVSREEVEAAWRFVDPVVRAWKHGLVPLTCYKPGSAPHTF